MGFATEMQNNICTEKTDIPIQDIIYMKNLKILKTKKKKVDQFLAQSRPSMIDFVQQ
jgi:hypothetical protein